MNLDGPEEESMTIALPTELPVLSAPRARALLLMWNPDAEIDDYVSVMEGDPALTSAVLRAANSAASWPVARVATAREAAIRIGREAVRQITTALIVRSEFDRLDESGIDDGELWDHLLAVGLLAERLAGDAHGPLAFTTGLLHDIGRLSMAGQQPAKYARVALEVESGRPAMEAEAAAFLTDHAAWGARIAEAWRFPDEVVEAIGSHHTGEGGALATAIHAARDLSWALGVGDGLAYPSGSSQPSETYSALVEELGGARGLRRHLRWYREATRPR